MNTRTLNLEEYWCRKCGRLFYYNTPHNLDHRLRWIRCLNGKRIQETNDGEQA